MQTPVFSNPLIPAVFVFGSNRAGRHGKGAALFAKMYFGAENGKGEGLSGCAYGIPTKDEQLKTLPLQDIKLHVDRFLAYARQERDTFFQVTRIGCGLAGYDDKQIAPLFARAPANVWIPGRWRNINGMLDRARLIVYGPPECTDEHFIAKHLLLKTGAWQGKFELITNHARGLSTITEAWMRAQDWPVTPFVEDTNRFGKNAQNVLQQQMSWYGTHLIAFSDGKHNDTLNMIKTAQENGLRVGIVDIITQNSGLEMLT